MKYRCMKYRPAEYRVKRDKDKYYVQHLFYGNVGQFPIINPSWDNVPSTGYFNSLQEAKEHMVGLQNPTKIDIEYFYFK